MAIFFMGVWQRVSLTYDSAYLQDSTETSAHRCNRYHREGEDSEAAKKRS